MAKDTDLSVANVSKHLQTLLKAHLVKNQKYKNYIINALHYSYSNGVMEGTNNLIKVIKRIAFGYRSFLRFKIRIL
ncbi:transposase, partial [Enterococcus sp.]|uniref:transposase n=1 Tax=Enterococcus sp. TaxID=35783 RepID=UPI002FCBEC29